MTKPRLAVLIASKNRTFFLHQVINSLSHQLLPTDAIFANDASDSESSALHQLIYSSNIYVTRSQNNGITCNRNFVMDLVNWKDFDYWTFLDDDVDIEDNYLHRVRNLISNGNGVAFTTHIQGLDLREPDWLGYLRGKKSSDGEISRIVSAIGTWMPSNFGKKFRYEGKFFYGYDEVELSTNLLLENVPSIYCKDICIKLMDVSPPSFSFLAKPTELHEARIYEVSRFMKACNENKLKILLFKFRSILHLILKSDNQTRYWAIKKYLFF